MDKIDELNKDVIVIHPQRVIKYYAVGIYARVSRFGRDTKEGLEAIRKIRDCGTRIIFETDKIDTETVDDELLLSVVQDCSQAENDWLSENIVWGLRRRAEDGMSGLYSRACYGYKKDRHGMLIIDEEQAKVVRAIFDWYLEGLSVGGIIERLKSKGVKSPNGKDIWSKRAVESTLTRRKYTGDAAIAVPGNAYCQYLNTDHHAVIISKETFEAVEFEMAARSNVEVGEDGKLHRKSKKYSSKKR